MSGPKPGPTPEQIKANLAALRAQGAPDDVIDRYMASVGAAPAAPTAAPEPPSVARGLALSGAKGASLGLADEAMGALDAFSPTGLAKALVTRTNPMDTYRRTRDEYRGQQRAFADVNPVSAGLAEFAGGLVPAIASAGTMAPLGPAKSAAAFGAAMGLGNAEGDVAKQAKGTALSAALSGTAAKVLPLLARPVGRVAGSLLTRSGLRDKTAAVVPGVESSTEKASQYIRRLFARDQVGPDEAMGALQPPETFYGRSPNTPQVMADVGGANVKRGLAGLAGLPGQTAQTGKVAMDARRADQFPRLLDATRRILKVSRTDADRVEQELIAAQRAAAKPAYDKAYAQGMIDDKDINRLLSNRWFRRAWVKARGVANDEGQPLPQLWQTTGYKEGVDELGRKFRIPIKGLVEKPDVRTLDYIKRELDGIIKRGLRNTGKGGLSSTEAQAIRKLRDQFVSRFDELAPNMAEARAQFAGDAAARDALESGGHIFSPTKRLTADEIAGLSDHERDLFLVGAFKALKQKLGAANTKRDLTDLLDAPEVLEQLQQAARSPEEFQQLLNVFRTEQSMAATEAGLTGSRTAPMAAQQADILEGVTPDVFTALGHLGRGNFMTGAAATARALFRQGNTSPIGSIADKTGEMLLQPATPGNIQSLLAPAAARPPIGPQVLGQQLGSMVAPQLSSDTVNGRAAAVQLRQQGLSGDALAQQLGTMFTPEVVRFVVAATPARLPQ